MQNKIRIDYDLQKFGVTIYDGIVGVHESQDADTKLLFYSAKLGDDVTGTGTQAAPFETYDALKTDTIAKIKVGTITEKYIHLVNMDDVLFEDNDANCIFLDTVSGNDANDGLTRATPVKTYTQAKTLITTNRTTIHVLDPAASIAEQITVPTQFEKYGVLSGAVFANNSSATTKVDNGSATDLTQVFVNQNGDKYLGRYLDNGSTNANLYSREISAGTLANLNLPSYFDTHAKTALESYDASVDRYTHREASLSAGVWRGNDKRLKVLPFYSNNVGKIAVVERESDATLTTLAQTLRTWFDLCVFEDELWAVDNDNSGGTGDIYKFNESTGLFVATGQTLRAWTALGVFNDELYAAVNSGDVYKLNQTSGLFVATGQTSRQWRGLCAFNGEFYATAYGGDIYKFNLSTGKFDATGQTSRSWFALATHKNNFYATEYGGDIYKFNLSTGKFDATGQMSRNWMRLISHNGDLFASELDLYRLNESTGFFENFLATGKQWRGLASFRGKLYALATLNHLYYMFLTKTPLRLNLMSTPDSFELINNLTRTDIIATYTESTSFSVALCASGDVYTIKNSSAVHLATLADSFTLDYDNTQKIVKIISKNEWVFIVYQKSATLKIAIIDKSGDVSYDTYTSTLTANYMPASWFIEAGQLYLDFLHDATREIRAYSNDSYTIVTTSVANYNDFLFHAHWYEDKLVKRSFASAGFSKLETKKDPTTANAAVSNAKLAAGNSIRIDGSHSAKYILADSIISGTVSNSYARNKIDTDSPTKLSLASIKTGAGALDKSTILNSIVGDTSTIVKISNSVLQGAASGNLSASNTIANGDIFGSIKVIECGLSNDYYAHLKNTLQGDAINSLALNRADYAAHGETADLGCHARDLSDVVTLFTQSRYIPKGEITHNTEQQVNEQRSENGAVDVYTSLEKEWESVEVTYNDVKKEQIDFYKLLSRLEVKTVNIAIDAEATPLSTVTVKTNAASRSPTLEINETISTGALIKIDTIFYVVIYQTLGTLVLDKPLHRAVTNTESFNAYETGAGGQYTFVPEAKRAHRRKIKEDGTWMQSLSFTFVRPVIWQ